MSDHEKDDTSVIQENHENNENSGTEKEANMVNSITQAIAMSMEKFGDKLHSTLSQSLSYDDYYDEEGEVYEDEADENLEPPSKKSKCQGQAFDVLEGMLDKALSSSTEHNDKASPKKPGSTVDGVLVEGPPNNPKIHGDPEYKEKIAPVISQDGDLVGEAVIHALQQELDTEGVAKEVDPAIAELVTALFKTGMAEEKVKTKMNSYLRPANAPRLAPVKVNTVIWDALPPHFRSLDLKMQKIHAPMLKGIIAAVEAASVLKSTVPMSKELGEALKKTFDSIVLMITATKELNLRRRELLKPAINREYIRSVIDTTPIPFATQPQGF